MDRNRTREQQDRAERQDGRISRRVLLVGAAAAGALTAPLLRAKPAGAVEGGNRMSIPAQAAQAAHASPLAAIFERNHVGWETKDPDLIASLASEDTIFWLHDGSEPVTGRDALRRHCVELFAAVHFSHVVGRMLYGEDHWILEWTMVLSLAEPDGNPFTARVEMLDVVTVDARGEVARKDVWMNGKQVRAAYARAGIER